jgi:hypothetical protein
MPLVSSPITACRPFPANESRWVAPRRIAPRTGQSGSAAHSRDQWGDQAGARLQAVVEQLQNHCRARPDFPLLTFERLQSERLLGPVELDFLKDRRVTFTPFAGSDSDDKLVILVALRKGYFTEAGILTETKGDICKVPE